MSAVRGDSDNICSPRALPPLTHSRHWWWASACLSKVTGSSFPTLPRKTHRRRDDCGRIWHLAARRRALGQDSQNPKMEGIVIDTNVFVAAGFNPRSASARVLAAVPDERFHLIWDQSTL